MKMIEKHDKVCKKKSLKDYLEVIENMLRYSMLKKKKKHVWKMINE